MSTARLTTTSYVVLGLIGLRGPSTSYDLKRAVGRSVGFFWSFPHAQLYSEPRRLATMDLLDVATEDEGRRRQTFSLTEQGGRALRRWLAEPVGEPMQVRDIAQLKLFFGELGWDDDMLTLARDQVRQHAERIGVYKSMEERFGRVESLAPRLVPLRLGIRLERAALDFWTERVDELDDSGRARDVS